MDLSEARDKNAELLSRLGDISANVDMGTAHIRKYKPELEMDIKASEKILEDLTAYLANLKQTVEFATKEKKSDD